MVYYLLFIICPPFVTTNWPHFWPCPWSTTMHQEIINRAGEKISPFEVPCKSVFLFQIWHMDPKNLPREHFRIAEKNTCVTWFWTWNAFHNHHSWNAPDACLFVEGWVHRRFLSLHSCDRWKMPWEPMTRRGLDAGGPKYRCLSAHLSLPISPPLQKTLGEYTLFFFCKISVRQVRSIVFFKS